MFPGYSRFALACVLALVGIAATAQPLEVQFVRAWQPPARSLDLSELSGFALAPDGTVFAMDRDRGALWRIAGNEATSTELAGKERPFEAKKVGGVAWMGDGRVAVGNTRNDLLAVIDAQGNAERVFGGGGGGHGELDDPEGLAFSVHRRLYVADQGNNRVAVYSETGVFLHSIGAGREPATALVKPFQVALDGAERVYVLEQTGSGRISIYDRTGALLKRLAPETLPGAQNGRWRAIAADLSGRLFVADSGNGNVAEIDWEGGQVRRRFGSPGRGRGQFSDVRALAIAGRELAVADAGNAKIEFFRLPEAAAAAPRPERLPSVRRASASGLECERAYAFTEGELLCLDARTGRVARVDPAGKVLSVFPAKIDSAKLAAFDAKDIAISDGSSIRILSHDGTERFAVGRSGSRDGMFSDIGGMHLADYLYVADSGNRRVQIFTRDGIFVGKMAETTEAQPRRPQRPVAVVTDPARNIYVADAESQADPRVLADARMALRARRGPRLRVVPEHERRRRRPGLRTRRHRARAPDGRRLQRRRARVLVLGVPRAAAGSDTRGDAVDSAQRLRPHAARLRSQAARRLSLPAVAAAGRRGRSARRPGPGARQLAQVGRALRGCLPRLRGRRARRPVRARGANQGARRRVRHRREGAFLLHRGRAHPARGRGRGLGAGRGPVPRPLPRSRAESSSTPPSPASTAPRKPPPATPPYVEYLGRSLLALGRHEAAIVQFQALGRRAGLEKHGLLLEAQALAASGDVLAARAVVERAIGARHADVSTYTLCADLSLQLRDAAGAVRCADIALAADAGNPHARALRGEALVRLGTVDKGVAELDAANAAAPNDADLWRRSGRVLLGLNRNPEALRRFARVLELQPRDADALLASAQIYLEQGELDQARTVALSLIGSPVQESRGQYVLGRIALKQSNPEDAVIAFARATRLDARQGAAWAGLAEGYLALKDDRKARDALATAAALPDAPPAVFRQLAEVEIRAGRHSAAVPALEKAVALQPNDAELRLTQARTLAHLERWHDAANAAREAQRLAPKNLDALVLGAEAAYRQGKNGEAIETLKRAVTLDPESYEVHYKLGRSYADNNLYSDAQSHLERAARLNDRLDAPHVLLAQMHLNQRSYDAAINSLTLAVALNPSDANRRELDTAYDRKKKALAGTGGRIVMEDLRLERMFVAAHKQYATEPLGRIRLRNDSAEDYQGLKLSFFIKEYMDFPVTREIAELKAKTFVEIPLNATFNRKVLDIDEDTRVLVITTLAMADARDGSQEVTQAMTLYGRNALVWANSDMIGSFITPRDDTLRNFVREAVNRYGTPAQAVLNRSLSQAATLFNTLGALGLRYQPDPNLPYSRLKADQVDYVQFPRETLRLKSGDCDDLSVLLAASLENLGIESALVEVPGHLFMMFRTGVKEGDRGLISTQEELLVIRDGEVWIPVESTLVATSFSEAWAEGARRYREAAAAEAGARGVAAPGLGAVSPRGAGAGRLQHRAARRRARAPLDPARAHAAPRAAPGARGDDLPPGAERQPQGRRRAPADRHHLRPQRHRGCGAEGVRGDPRARPEARLGAQQPRQPVLRARRL